jgi:hypothetical protein
MRKIASLSRSILIPCTILTVACDDQTTEQVRESVERESVEEAKEPSATAPPWAPMPDNPATPGPLEERANTELKSADGEAIGGEVEFQATLGLRFGSQCGRCYLSATQCPLEPCPSSLLC